MSEPVLSIVVPAYNVERYVGEAVASALAQTLAGIEVVVVDDGSTDGTPAVLASLADPRLRVVRQANAGLSAARNAGIRAARAELVGFLDGDDRWHPGKAARHLAHMRDEPGVGISYSHSAYVDEDGRDTGRRLVSASASPDLRAMILRNRVGNGSTPVVRAACFREAGTFDETLRSCEDWEMWVRILRDTRWRAGLVPEVLTDYRINTRSLSMMDPAPFLRAAEAAAARVRRETPGMPGSVVDRGLAMSYRIAATKAYVSGDRRTALGLVGRALRLAPSLAVSDPRLAGTLAALAAPRWATAAAHRAVAALAGARRGPVSPGPLPR